MDIVSKKSNQDVVIKPTFKRYFILLMFVILASIKSFQWVYFATITNVISKFYNVSNIAVNWAAIMFMVTFLTLALPTCWVMDRIGLRNSVLIGTFGLTLGVVIKCFSCEPDGFALSLFGHLIIGLVEPFFYSSCSQVAIYWFPDDQLSLATAIGFVGDSMGLAVGFLVPTLMVGKDLEDTEAIQKGLFLMSLIIAIITVLNSLLIVIFFDDQPKHVPGVARYKQLEAQKKQTEIEATSGKKKGAIREFVDFYQLIAKYFANKNFVMIQIGFGINLGVAAAIHTILNQIINGDSKVQYSDPNLVVGNTGLLLIVAGLLGSVICGKSLDKFHAYKTTTIFFYLMSLVSLAAFTYCLEFNSPLALYIVTSILGFFLTGYCCCSIEFAVETTYPLSGLNTLTMLHLCAQVFGITVTFVGSMVVDEYGSTIGSWFLCASLFVGLLATCMTKADYRRQSAIEKGCTQEIEFK